MTIGIRAVMAEIDENARAGRENKESMGNGELDFKGIVCVEVELSG
jgi:hypothetical protein